MNVSRAGSLPQGGVHELLHRNGWLSESVVMSLSAKKNSLRRKRLANSLMSACTSGQLMRCGVGTKVNPRERSLISACESCTLERLITVSSACMVVALCLLERALRLFLLILGLLVFRGEGWLVVPLIEGEAVASLISLAFTEEVEFSFSFSFKMVKKWSAVRIFGLYWNILPPNST